MRKTAIVVSLLIGVLGLSACGAEQQAPVTKKGDSSVVESSSPSASPAPKAAQVGDTVKVADWEVTVTKVELNANAAIHRANEFNDKPKNGHHYVLVTFKAAYKGSKRTADIQSDLTWSYTGADKQVNNEASAVTPTQTAQAPTESRAGGTVTGQAVFDLADGQIHGGILSVQGYTDSFDQVYADFDIA